MSSLLSIPGFEGDIYDRNHAEYKYKRYQYAFTTHSEDHNMSPGAVIYPKNGADIVRAINFARTHNPQLAIAVRTGGHQYSGASSTFGDNLLMDLSDTFRDENADFQVLNDGANGRTPQVKTSISWALAEFNAKMKSKGLFIPHGQCSHVHLGGHVQTGGYGQLGRSFGLFGDHVESFDIYTANGEKVTATKTNQYADLFYAVLGGSPGNFGILTHLTLRCYHDREYPESRGFRVAYFYNKTLLKKHLDFVVEMASDLDYKRDYDFCVTVLSASADLLHILPGLDEEMRRKHGDDYGKAELAGWPPIILVYAQCICTEGYRAEEKAWFQKVERLGGIHPKVPFSEVPYDQHTDMSVLTGNWVFTNVREFDDPYEKRTYMTNSTTLATDGWAAWVTDRIDKIQSGWFNNCRLSVQIQPFGGKNSRFFLNGQDGSTSYSWRDSTLCCVLDCFYSDVNKTIRQKAKKLALDWQANNDAEGIGPNGKFSKTDRRVFWGSYGEFDLSKAWQFYYEDEEKYNRLREIKERYDPTCLFNPNTFAITPVSQESGVMNEKLFAKRLRTEHLSRLTNVEPVHTLPVDDAVSSSIDDTVHAGTKRKLGNR